MFRSLEEKNKKDLQKLEEMVQSTIHRLQVSRFMKNFFLSFEQFYAIIIKIFYFEFFAHFDKNQFF